jgi:hypothetical protein
VSQYFPPSPVSPTARLLSAVASGTLWICTATTPPHAQLTRTAGNTVRTQHGVTASAGQRRGDVEIRNYLRDSSGPGDFSPFLHVAVAHYVKDCLRAREDVCAWSVWLGGGIFRNGFHDGRR